MSSNKKIDDEITARVNKLLSKGNSKRSTDEELVERFSNVFSATPIVAQKKLGYDIPKDVCGDDIEKEIEKMLQESDDEDEDAIDSYIYGVLRTTTNENESSPVLDTLDSVQKVFLGSDRQFNTDESDELIRRAQEENALDAKYEKFQKKKDEDIEKRYLELKKDKPNFDDYVEKQRSDKPKGSIPKSLSTDDFHDEMDDWCCICNEDATVECEDCDDEDSKYCTECYFHTHRSESADYEATKHKSKPYRKHSK